MKSPPTSVIHINFLAGELLFDARHIWNALREAEQKGRVPSGLSDRLFQEFGETAIHLATRHYIMKQAVKEFTVALRELYDKVPEPWEIPKAHGFRVVRGVECERARDHVLLATDSFLFEFRAYLELLARFVDGLLTAIGKGAAQVETLSSGENVEIRNKRGKLITRNFLVYVCDKVSVKTEWFTFLSSHRNFFTHQGAPYCAIEDMKVRPPEFDLLIMKSNIHDFQSADPSSYFRVSELQEVVKGISALGEAAQRYVIYKIQEDSAGRTQR